MAISHFKHSYLDWRTIPCKRRNDLCFCSFSTFSIFLDSRLVKFFKCMTWQSIFFFFYDLSAPSNDAYHRWTSSLKHLFSYEDRFERVRLFGPKLFASFLSKKRIMAQKYFSEMGNFGQRAPSRQSRWSLRISWSWGLVFLVLEKVRQVWSCSKSWCVPNYPLSVSFKNSSFFVAWFPKNSRNKFLNQEFYGQLPEKAWSNGLFDFFKIVPLEAPGFSKDFKVEESVY